ncbi:MAG: hypothetical protein ABIH21_03160 [Patescibacteria group bacterium]
MFELHLGENLRISSDKFKEGFFVTGNPGQGKTTFLVQLALEVIKNKQTGLIIDPYGDFAKDIQSHLKSDDAKQQVEFTNLDINQDELNSALKEKVIVATGNYLTEGNRVTAQKIQKLLKQFYTQAQADQWLIVDEPLSCIDDELFEHFITSTEKGLNCVFSDSDFVKLSEDERAKFAKAVQNFVIYKPRNINSVLMAKERPVLNPDDIKAIKQYYFQILLDGKMSYIKSLFPIKDI